MRGLSQSDACTCMTAAPSLPSPLPLSPTYPPTNKLIGHYTGELDARSLTYIFTLLSPVDYDGANRRKVLREGQWLTTFVSK